MQRFLHGVAATMAVGVLFGAAIHPSYAQVGSEYTHQDYNSIAARAVRQQIMNEAILRQAKHGHRGAKSHKHIAKKHAKHKK